MSECIFRRVETKYILTSEEKNILLNKIKPYIEKDMYFKSSISNLYFDNENNDLIVESLEKPIYKEKIRLRTYNTPSMEDKVFLEIKFKNGGIVGKRRIELKLKEYYDFINNGNYDKDNQIMKELVYHIKHFNIYPKICLSYDRESYKGIYDNGLRITFDSNLRSRRNDLKLESGSYGEKFFDDDRYIMEIKSLESLPLWFTSVLSELKIYPESFSKYGSIYRKESGSLC